MMAADTVKEFFERSKDEDATWPFKMDRHLSYADNRLLVSLKLANQRIHGASAQEKRLKGMGTTVVLAQINGDKLHVAHVGDSRCYRIRNGRAQQITRDHSLLLEDYKDARPDMSAEEQKRFPHKNVITRALGMREGVEVDITTEQITDGDIFILCSDGLTGMVEDEKLPEAFKGDSDLEEAVTNLVQWANDAGGSDNITVLALECHT